MMRRETYENAVVADALEQIGENPELVLAVEALSILEESPRSDRVPRPPGEAPVVDTDGRPVGVVMLKDLLRSGIV